MNKLINRISPETSENRILHAGFSIILMSEEITQTLSGLSSDMIIFILSGSITIYSTKEEKKTIGEQYMIFLRSFENYTYDITLGSKIIIFFFDSLTMNELPYYQHPYGILPQPISKWIELKIVEPLYGFLELVGQYLENNFLNYPLYELKRTELFYLLKKLYKSRKTKRDGCEKRNAFIETKTKCASNLIRKVTAYLQNQSKTPSLYIKINGIQMDF